MEPKEGLSRRIFIKSAAAAGITLVGLTGCGSQDDVVFTGSGGGPNGQTAPGVPQVNVPTLSFTSRVEPAAVPGVDAGTRYSVRVVASQGGKFTLPDGTIIFIPPDAFPADTEISVVIPTNRTSSEKLLGYLFEPSGLVLNSPIFITLPLTLVGPGDVAMSFTSSTASPIVDVGSERTNWQLSVPAEPPAGAGLTLSLSHFTFLFGAVGTDLGMYLVTAIPPENLEVGDFVFFLTGPAENGIRWKPGHVAALIKEGADNNPLASNPGRCVEMGGLGAGELKPVELEHIEFSYDHIYLGPRRHPQGLTASEKLVVRDYWLSKRGTPYALMGDQGDNVLEYEEGFSCVGMCEVGLRKVNKGVFSWLARQFVSTPLEFYIKTVPVTEITVVAGKKFVMPVYGVVADSSESVAPFLKGLLQGFYSRTERYDIAPLTFPPNSTFVPTNLPTSSYPGPPTFGTPAPGYLFSWTPSNDEVGQTFELELLMVANRVTWQSGDALFRDESRRTLKFKVIRQGEYVVVRRFDTPADPQFDQTLFSTPRINSAGDLGFYQQDRLSTGSQTIGPVSVTFMPALGAPTVVDTGLGEGGNFLEPDGVRFYSLLALNETGELAYYRLGDSFAESSLRIKRPGTPAADLGVNADTFLLGEALEKDGDGRIFLFGGGILGPSSSTLAAVSLGVATVNLDLATQSGENFAVFQGLDINESALAIVIGLRSAFESLNAANTVLLYQYPRTDLAERVEVVLPLSEGRQVTAAAINNLGEYAYASFRIVGFSSEDRKLTIHKADGSERILDLNSMGQPRRLKLVDTGEAFFLLSDGRLMLLPVDGAPIILNQYFPEDFGLCGGFDVDKFGRRIVVTSQNQDKLIVLEKADSPSPT